MNPNLKTHPMISIGVRLKILEKNLEMKVTEFSSLTEKSKDYIENQSAENEKKLEVVVSVWIQYEIHLKIPFEWLSKYLYFVSG